MLKNLLGLLGMGNGQMNSAQHLMDLQGQVSAISKSQGVIEFSLDGTVTLVNDNFLGTLGYSREEAIGQHHSKFVTAAYSKSEEYRAFWAKLKRGEFDSGVYKRIAKDGREIWIQASYNPVMDSKGKPYKVIKFATDITQAKQQAANFEGQMTAISKVMGVIEFDTQGYILAVNDNFAQVTGYAREDIIGKHHSMFAEEEYKTSLEYKAFWEKLGSGIANAGQFKRIGKNGREIWLEASYNPIFDMNGKPFKVVKYATDITREKLQAADFEGQLTAISKVMGVIEFDTQGNILQVNDNFAQVTGYAKADIVGKHHSMFAEPAYKTSAEYKSFWENLALGLANTGQFKRIGKDGREIWLQASYNPIFDMNGKPFKVVKYATDITAQVHASKALVTAVEQTQVVIEAAQRGDLSKRIPVADKTGDIAQLCDGLNALVSNMESSIAQIKTSGDILSNAVNETQKVVDAAKHGDLSQRIPLQNKEGEILNLCSGVNALVETMTEIVVQIKYSSENIITASTEISNGNNDLSTRTEEQASSLEETASSMEELASTVKLNAENSKQASSLANTASAVASKGGTMVNKVVLTMVAISDSSKKIEDIISVIDGIAFQTNILALNAAVEAARAGEQGRGFAVVAGEVRNLAQRSASAAKEIKQLISDSADTVETGRKLVEDAGGTMDEIVSSVKRVADIILEITAASAEQSTGIDQMNNAIEQIDQVTQQNAALVEESAAAAESLVEQANELLQAVSKFSSADRRHLAQAA